MVACNQQPPPWSHPGASTGALGRQLGGGVESPCGDAANVATGVAYGDSTTCAALGCCRSCPLGQSWTKTALRRAIGEGYLTRDGRATCCGSMVRVSVAVTLPVEVPKASTVEPVKRARVSFPYKKQACDVVVQAGLLELVYAPLVATPARVEKSSPASGPCSQVNPEIPLWCAPRWMVPVAPKSPAPRVPLTQGQEFALLKRRLTLVGKAINRSRRRERIDRAYECRRMQAAYKAAYAAALQRVKQVATKMGAKEVLRDLMREPELSKAQEALVASACQKAREDQAAREAWLAHIKHREQKECPHVLPREDVVVMRVVPECTTPWAHLGLHITFFRGKRVVDGTLGAKCFIGGDLIFTKRIPKRNPQKSADRLAPTVAVECATSVVGSAITLGIQESIPPAGHLESHLFGSDTWLDYVSLSESQVNQDSHEAAHGNATTMDVVASVEPLMVAERQTIQPVEVVNNTKVVFDWGAITIPHACNYSCEDDEWEVFTGQMQDELLITSSEVIQPEEAVTNTSSALAEELVSFGRQIELALVLSELDAGFASLQKIACLVQWYYWDYDMRHYIDVLQAPIEASEVAPATTADLVEQEEKHIMFVPPPPPLPDWDLIDAQKKYCCISNVCYNILIRKRERTYFDISWASVCANQFERHCVRLNQDRVLHPDCKMERFYCGRKRKPEFHRIKAALCTFGQEYIYVQRRGAGPYQKVDEEDVVIGCQIWYTAACALQREVEECLFVRKCDTVEIEEVSYGVDVEAVRPVVNECPLPMVAVCNGIANSLDGETSHDTNCWMCKWVSSNRGISCGDAWFEVPNPKPSRGMREATEHRLFCYNAHVDCRISSITEDVQHLMQLLQVDFVWLSRRPSFEQHLHVHYFGPVEELVSRERYYIIRRDQNVDSGVLFVGSTLGEEILPKYASLPVFDRGSTSIADLGLLKKLAHFVGYATCNGVHDNPELQERMDDVQENHGVQSIASLVETLSSRKAEVAGAGENRVADKRALSEKAVFHQPGVLSCLRSKGEKTFTAANLNADREIVRMQPKGKPSFTPLPRMSSEQMRKLLEKGIGSTSSVALDLGIQSHIPQGMPVVAFVDVMDTRIENPQYASLCGSYLDLGRDRAKTLCLPLANFPMSKALEDSDDVLHGLCLATYFQDPISFGIGRPAFQYGTLEFQEFKPSAYSDYTRVRDTWDQIAKQQNCPKDRVIAGFSVLGAVSQDYDQPLPEFENIELQCPPTQKPPVVTFNKLQRFDRAKSHRTFNMPSTGFGGVTGRDYKALPVVDRGMTLKQEGVEYTPARYATCEAHLVDIEIACVIEGVCPADARAGQVLKRVQFREATYLHNNKAVMDWISAGLVSPNIRLRLTTGTNLFIGVTLGVCLDYYNRCDTNIVGDNLPSAVSNALPNLIFPVSKGSEAVAALDVQRELGHGLFASVDSFEQPFLIVYVVGDNALPAASDWRFTLELLFSKMEPSGVALEPLVTLPHTFNGILPLGVWRGPHEFNLGINQPSLMRLKLDFATRRVFGTGAYSCLSFPAAYASWIQGHAGWLVGEVIHIGTHTVQCGLHVCVTWSQSVSILRDALKIPGVRLSDGSGKFRLPLFSPFERISLVDPIAELCLFAIGGPIATVGTSAPFQYMVRFDAIEGDEAVPRVIGGTDSFAWANLSKFRAGFEFDFIVPARLCDIIRDDCQVLMCDNPLASLVASCGIMSGDMTVTIMWGTEKERGALSGCVKATTCFGRMDIADRTQVLSTKVAHMGIDTSISVEVPVKNFSGYTGSRATPYIKQVYLLVAFSDRRVLTEIDVSVRLHPGFRFFGRSIAFPAESHH
uniref:Polyprotein 2 n=1 Tax=Shoestring fern seco-like virus TaxID=2933188 RepID=A0A9C7GWN4_9SECO|nr:polyprotein 2 [Shoestring fern seco-like virus]CAI5383991.1 polyprotein 2 [Shoestring fern seco-like virus]